MNLQNINDIGHGQEVVNVMKKVGLGMSIREFSIELTFAERLTSHFEEANKVDGHTFRMIRDFDDPSEIGGIRVVQIIINGDDLLNQNVNRKHKPLVFLVDHQCLFIQSMIRRNLSSVSWSPLMHPTAFAPCLRGSSEEQNVLDITVVAECGGLDDNFV